MKTYAQIGSTFQISWLHPDPYTDAFWTWLFNNELESFNGWDDLEGSERETLADAYETATSLSSVHTASIYYVRGETEEVIVEDMALSKDDTVATTHDWEVTAPALNGGFLKIVGSDDTELLFPLSVGTAAYEAVRTVGSKAAYSTGTVSLDETGLIVTLDGGSFSGWEQGDAITIDGETCYIDTVNSNTELVLQESSTKSEGTGLSFSMGVPYANLAACAAADAGFTDSVKYIQVSVITDNAALAFNKNLNGKTVTITSNKRHNGNFQGGWLTTFNMSLNTSVAMTITNSSTAAGGKFIVDNLSFIYTGNTTVFGIALQLNSATTNITNTVSNTIINANGKDLFCFRTDAANNVTRFYNCIAANGAVTTSLLYAVGFSYNSTSTSSVTENCIAYSMSGEGRTCGFWNNGNRAIILTNCASLNCGKDFGLNAAVADAGLGNAVASKCASSDLTGSEVGLRSLADTAQFQSVTITDGDLFLKLKSTSILIDAGVAPSIAENTTGIRGTARPHDTNKYSIGADEWLILDDFNIFSLIRYNPAVRKFLH